ADRLDILLTHRHDDVPHIVELIAPAGEDRSPRRAMSPAPDSALDAYRAGAQLAAAAADNQASVELLAAEAARAAAGRDVVATIGETATESNIQLLGRLRPHPAEGKQRKFGS